MDSRSVRLCSSVDSLTSIVSDTGDVTETDMLSLNADVDRFSQAVSQLKTTLSAVPCGKSSVSSGSVVSSTCTVCEKTGACVLACRLSDG